MAAVTVQLTPASLQKALRNVSAYDRSTRNAIRNAINITALNIQSKAKQNATHRPGPRVDTGRLRSSINAKFAGEDAFTWVVFTNVEYALRLEFGFKGTDKRGRKYNQQAYPFMNPAAESERAAYVRRLRAAIDGAGKGIPL